MSTVPYGMMTETNLAETPRAAWNRATWGPIMMGVVTAIGVQFIFTVLGLAIGVTSMDHGDAASADRGTVGVAAGAWWLVTGAIAIMLGGYVYGRTAGLARVAQLYLGAIAMWGVIALFGFIVIWSGAGIAAASPLTLIATPTATMPQNGVHRTGMGNDTTDSATGAASGVTDQRRIEPTPADAERARSAARTASWWSVIGLAAGIAASLAGARMGVPRPLRARTMP